MYLELSVPIFLRQLLSLFLQPISLFLQLFSLFLQLFSLLLQLFNLFLENWGENCIADNAMSHFLI